MDNLKDKIARLRDMDAPSEVVKKYEDVLTKKVKKALDGKKMSWDPLNNCWVEDEEEGILLEPAAEPSQEAATAQAPKITIMVKVGK
jgi:hypothetical protein